MRRLTFLVAALLLCASAHAMDLRDLPDWVRRSIWPVEVDWQALAAEPTTGPGGVHLSTPSPVTLGAPPTLVPPAGGMSAPAPRTVGVTAPGLPTGEGVHVPGLGLDLSGTGVRPGSAAEITGIGGVHVEEMGAEWDEMLASIEGLDRETLARAGQILAMIREQNMSPEQFAAWAKEHQVTPEVLTAALMMTAEEWRTHYPELGEVASALTGVLCLLAGAELEDLQRIPPPARPYLAIYLGKRGNGRLALAALGSLSDDEMLGLPRTLLYRASSHLMSDAPRAATVVLKRYGTVFGVERMLCHELMRTCRHLADPEVVETSLIPYAEAALGDMPPTDFWEEAAIAVVWGYAFCGMDAKASAAGLEWLARAEALGCRPYAVPTLRVKAVLATPLARTGRSAQAVEMLQDVLARIPPASTLAETAQADLMSILRSRAEQRVHSGGVWNHG